MENIWSENKYINLTINILMFLLGLNVFHYGQLLLPAICLLLFIDNKFKFFVNNLKTFIILCLFAFSFFIFSYKQGIYSVIGFCLPMAYYIGSNIKEINEKNIKTIIYILGFGMISHVILNMIYDISLKGFHIFFSSSHYDIWTKSKISASTVAIDYIFYIGTFFYLITNENNKAFKALSLFIFVVIFVYCFGLGERKTILAILFSIIVPFIFNIKRKGYKKVINKKSVIRFSCVLLIIISVTIILYFYSVEVYHLSILNARIINKFLEKGLNTERISIFLETIANAKNHYLGNREISSTIGIMPHDLWLDIFDWGGVVTLLLFIMYTFLCFKILVKFLKNKEFSNEFKLLIGILFINIFLQVLLEPIMSSATIFLICTIIVEAILEKAII